MNTHPNDKSEQPSRPPNILLITCDQYRFPRFSYGRESGFDEALKNILGFQGEVGEDNPFAKFFPGLLRLRKNAVLLRDHTIAASACTPSRATIYTGQYGTKTGVTQTDGLFKNGDAANFPWLDADGIPTLGSWMREAGYSTHYFGKWHFSDPPEHSLECYGFDNWEESYPEPHGARPGNLGIYRDVGFADSACSFIRRKGLALDYNRRYAEMSARDPGTSGPDPDDIKPWLAVASFTNPHDIATYPGVIAQAMPGDSPRDTQPVFGPLSVPAAGEDTLPPTPGTMTIPLNPLDFPQACAKPAPTQNETLADKPSCQHEYAYKMGLALAAKAGFNIAGRVVDGDVEKHVDTAVALALKSCIPMQLSDDPDEGCRLFLQLYAWLHAVVDPHINAVLDALEESGQAANTIVVFLTDHGEYGTAHGMMIEKWHTAYQEALHVPVVVQFPMPGGAQLDVSSDSARAPAPSQLDALTSHIDVLPTVLGLAGVNGRERVKIGETLAKNRPVPPLPGVDLSGIIENALGGDASEAVVNEPDGRAREGVLFITDDEITAPLPPSRDGQEAAAYGDYAIYKAVVDAVREGTPEHAAVALEAGPVKQPNHVRCVRTRTHKLARYFDPFGEAPQEWEMYDLRDDPNEAVNLVEVTASPPKARADLPDTKSVQAEADRLAALLEALEKRNL